VNSHSKAGYVNSAWSPKLLLGIYTLHRWVTASALLAQVYLTPKLARTKMQLHPWLLSKQSKRTDC